MVRRDARAEPGDDDIEAPEADLHEQRRSLTDDSDDEADADIPADVDPADAQDQQLSVEFDEDDYR